MGRQRYRSNTNSNKLDIRTLFYLTFASVLLGTLINKFQLPTLFNGSNSHIDPYLYSAYERNFETMRQRWGSWYYSNRISAIFPSELIYYLTMKNVYIAKFISSTCIIFLNSFTILRTLKFYTNTNDALRWSLVFVLNPLFLHQLGNDYTAQISVSYLLLTIYNLHKRSKAGLLWAGIFAAFSLNANEHSIENIFLSIFVFALMKYYLYQTKPVIKVIDYRNLARMDIIAFGFVLGQIILGILLCFRIGWTWENMFFQKSTINFFKYLSNNSTYQYYWLPLSKIEIKIFLVQAILISVLVIYAIIMHNKKFHKLPENDYVKTLKIFHVYLGVILTISVPALMLTNQFVLRNSSESEPMFMVFYLPALFYGVYLVTKGIFQKSPPNLIILVEIFFLLISLFTDNFKYYFLVIAISVIVKLFYKLEIQVIKKVWPSLTWNIFEAILLILLLLPTLNLNFLRNTADSCLLSTKCENLLDESFLARDFQDAIDGVIPKSEPYYVIREPNQDQIDRVILGTALWANGLIDITKINLEDPKTLPKDRNYLVIFSSQADNFRGKMKLIDKFLNEKYAHSNVYSFKYKESKIIFKIFKIN